MTTAWPRVVAQCADMGIVFDQWQHGAGSIILGKRADGKYAATVGGVVLSIPRQVGKTFLVGMIVIALCILHPGMTVLWTAHRTRTGSKTFQSMQGYVKRRKIAPHILGIRSVNGEQEIRFRNGSVIMFGARADGFGRGFDEVDIEVFDEAQILSEKALEDMIAATNQSRQEAGALLFFMGTPPRPSDAGEEFANRREKALSGKSKNMVYIEFGADRAAKLDDHKQWAKANPSFPHHTPIESMERMRENLTNEDSFRREGLGIWDDTTGATAFGPAWAACGGERPSKKLPVAAYGIAADLDLEHAAITAAYVEGDVVHVKPVEHAKGAGWVVDKAVALNAKKAAPFVVDGTGPAAVLIPKLKTAGLRVVVAKAADSLDACADIVERARQKTFRHANYPELNQAVDDAVKKASGDRWKWERRPPKGAEVPDITPLEAATWAVWALARPAAPPPEIF
ncbi:terminase family protein [Luteipulveratus mongoliensis]|uniref:terminase family protein n=1 Tax=Luteipulveratus mongoliensis TaxID=571913 RepID=UPI0012EE4E88|nr:terminase family protein [Luteipulveratus mongoliensis]